MKLLVMLLAIAMLAGCRDDAHPRELIGSWVSDQTMGGDLLRVVDTLELRTDGTGIAHRRMYSFTPSLRIEGGIDTVITDKGRAPTVWSVVRNEDGRHLCLADRDGGHKECEPLHVVPETRFTWGSFEYRRIK